MRKAAFRRFLLPLLTALLGLAACSVNPVTGERNFQLYGTDWEREVGQQMYAPMKQSQGGDFILDPELTAYVEEVGDRLAQRARRAGELEFEFSILNDSVPNAWALPGGKIVVNRGLLTRLRSEAELAAVLGHEVVHADAAHSAQAQSKGVLTQAGAVVSMVVLGSTIDSPAARDVAMIVPALGAQMLTQKYGRDAEREADVYGMRYMSEAGYDTGGAVELQKTFLALADNRDPDWLSGLFASHPPSRERLQNNRKTAGKLPPGGETGTDRYLEKTAYLRRVQPAYDAYDEAQKALQKGDRKAAQAKLDEALALEPRESLFHALQGDIHALEKNRKQALSDYERAIDKNPGFFYGYLRAGQMQYVLERHDPARRNLGRSLELMPTAEAHYLLGMLDRERGNLNSAVAHFQSAAGSDSESGKLASRELVLMDLERNPSKYIATGVRIDSSGKLWALLGNRTSVSVENIEISFAWLDDQGQTRQGRTSLRGPLRGGEQTQVALGFSLQDSGDPARRVRVEVTAARVAN